MTYKELHQNPEEAHRTKVLENTFYYLENYLNPNKKWNIEITPKQRFNRIRYANVNWDTVSNHIKDMDYRNFLKTPYWKAIAAHTKYKAGYRCQLCNSANNLVTHHRNYSIHGFEHAYIQELTVLCDDCHNKFHNRFSKWKLKLIMTLTILSVLLIYPLLESIFNKEQSQPITKTKEKTVRNTEKPSLLESIFSKKQSQPTTKTKEKMVHNTKKSHKQK